MKRGGGHSKGASWERECCKRLSKFFTAGERDDLFWRTAMSGGRATLQARKGKSVSAQVGDIGAIDSDGEYHFLRHVVVECKHHHNLHIERGFISSTGNLHAFWVKHCGDAVAVRREPVLIARQDRTPTLLIMTGNAAEALYLIEGYRRVLTLDEWCGQPWVYLFDEVVPKLDAKW